MSKKKKVVVNIDFLYKTFLTHTYYDTDLGEIRGSALRSHITRLKTWLKKDGQMRGLAVTRGHQIFKTEKLKLIIFGSPDTFFPNIRRTFSYFLKKKSSLAGHIFTFAGQMSIFAGQNSTFIK